MSLFGTSSTNQPSTPAFSQSQPASSTSTAQPNPSSATSGALAPNPAPPSNPFGAFGGSSTSASSQPSTSSNLFSSFNQNNANTGTSGGTSGSTGSNPFGSTNPSASSNIFGTSTTAPNSTTNPQPTPLFGGATAANPLFGGFGSTTGAPQPQQTNSLFGTNTLVGQPFQTTTQPSTLPFGQTQAQPPVSGLIRTSKFNDLSDNDRQHLELFDASIQSQIQLSNELKAKKLGEDIEKATTILSGLMPSSDLIWNALRSDEDVTRDLKAKLDTAIQDETIATQILDGFQDVAKSGYLQTHANFPFEYYTQLTFQLEARLETYKSTIDVIERKLSSLAEPHKRSPQAISNTLRTQHALFMALASRAAELDITMKRIRQNATVQWRAQTGSARDPFDRGFGASIGPNEPLGQSILRTSQLR
ncbi:uncharacterized protein EI90DRAFT_3117386 [Cantharellus anzutake]|uniref:uncharacterized protein n=1 Tax=Cantharellus anzutake TaxID=1750568 RepID=UPI001903792C|nr:uncharacterized protein EI90DRAFT_3117386 [Cantharellus anzutake]KAF8339575.1 hypothetical protein EI90DRAFT_3117386 [Cantharellus anzutake]